jgi:hypothetical protein
MSEYQFYEFRAIDQPLSDEDMAAVRQISSRVEPTRTRATFVYNYGDFPRDPKSVLVQYFDAMIYLANWGSKQLLFRFPRNLIDLERVKLYAVEDVINFSTIGEYVVLDISLYEEEGYGWIEGEGWLSSLVGLREDILRQDYRVLYLAWLKAIGYEELTDDVYEPPLPPGLKQLSPLLEDFMDLFEIDENLVQVAAQASPAPQTPSVEQLYRAIPQLSRAECDEFLVRLAQGEINLSTKFNRRLRELAGKPPPVQTSRRTISQLLTAADEHAEREKEKEAAEAEAKRLKALQALAQRESQAWQEVDSLIQVGQAKPYDDAVQLIDQLWELAVHQEQEIAFRARLKQIYEQYSRRSALMRRLRGAGFPK